MSIVFTKKFICISYAIICVFGTLLHFAYSASNSNFLVGIFAPVNESLWEHMKLVFVPFTLYAIYVYVKYKGKYQNVFIGSSLATLFCIILLTLFSYIAKYINISSIAYDIASYYIVMLIGIYLLLYLSSHDELITEYSLLAGLSLTFVIACMFILCTISPPHIQIMQDPITQTYGIYKKH